MAGPARGRGLHPPAFAPISPASPAESPLPSRPLALDLSEQAAAELGLVLTAVGIRHELNDGAAGSELWVDERDWARAATELRDYLGEKHRAPRPPRALPRYPHAAWGAVVYAATLMSVSAAALYGFGGRSWTARGVLDADLFLRGEWWRVFTALTLHADAGHLFANLFFGVLFAYPAAQLLGVGVAWLAIVICGGFAYAVDAWLAPSGHSVLGASTAVFVALGLASAYSWRWRTSAALTRMQRAAPLVAGVALLAFTGAGGERTDLLAHLLGFSTGVLAGLALARLPLPAAGENRPQWWAAATAAGTLGLSWGVALW